MDIFAKVLEPALAMVSTPEEKRRLAFAMDAAIAFGMYSALTSFEPNDLGAIANKYADSVRRLNAD